ncbi:cytokinesis protein 3 [Actinomortierella wolfii]|nr:cytokinesis protein 3 [Actinomortierella wolfii]
MPVSPPTPSTVVTAITSGTPDWSSPRSMGTPASDASILMGMVSPSSSYHVRNRLSLSSRTAIVRHSSDSARGDSFSHDVYETGVDIESLDNPDPDNLPMHVDGMIYQACKPKATLIRAIKQIINPRKVAEKDAIKSQQDHFAWVEMQKSLKRVRSPEPGSKSDFHQQYFPPTAVTTPLPFSNASSFIQVDKLARNVNQKSPQLTPQMLSQKFLTRPYARSPLLKLRVLFIWVSENIRLEGGPMRDVSGGRYKLGPVGDIASTYYPAANGSVPSVATSAIAKAINQTLSITSPISTRKTPASSSANLAAAATVAALSSYGDTAAANNALSDGTHPSAPVMSAATAAAFMQGMEDCSKCFLAEDEPECAQEVLTNRVCRTGEGFANLFAEMAVAAGITDVGVVKGHLKGPMDVFAKEIPPPNHAWNVVKIDGAYRFIDCCLASPFYPGHYPNKSKEALSFYFLTSPNDLILTHYPVFMSYQYLSPPITPSVFLQLPFVRPPFFDYNLRFLDFKKRTCLDIRDDQPVEVLLVIGAGEGIDLRAEVEAMTAEGKVVKKRALAQVTVWRPNSNLQGSLGSGTSHAGNGEDAHSAASIPHVFPLQGTKRGQPISQLSALAAAGAMATVVPLGSGGTGLGNSNINRLGGRSGAGTSGIRIAKIKAILPPETVACAGSIRKGVLHIYAGRKVENALADAMPYSLAISLPIRHTGTLPKTPFSFVLPHFSPYEYYIKSPQTELLYYPHTYKFSVLSLAALSQAAATPIINPIHWTDLSPSSSMAIEPVSPAPDSATSQTPPISSLASPPPLPLSHSSTAATTAGGTSGRAWTSNSGTVGGIQMRNSAAMGSSASVGSAASSSLKLTADQVSTRLSGTNNGNASMTTSGPKPSFIDQRRTSLQYNGYTSHQQQILPPHEHRPDAINDAQS